MKVKAPELKQKFVNFTGEKVLIAKSTEGFVKGDPKNDWPTVFNDFSKQIKEYIGAENHTNLMPKFSTSSELHKTIHECSLMSAMQYFFKFRCQTDCGISKVRLEGKLEDWEKLRDCA